MNKSKVVKIDITDFIKQVIRAFEVFSCLQNESYFTTHRKTKMNITDWFTF